MPTTVKQQTSTTATLKNYPWHTWSVCVILAGVFGLSLEWPMARGWLVVSSPEHHPWQREWFQWFTYGWLHVNQEHVARNILILMACGMWVETWNRAWFWGLFLTGMMGGALYQVAMPMSGNPMILMCGASAGVMALAVFVMITGVTHKPSHQQSWWRWSAWTVATYTVMSFGMYDVWPIAEQMWQNNNLENGIMTAGLQGAYGAHAGGVLMGLMGSIWAGRYLNNKHR